MSRFVSSVVASTLVAACATTTTCADLIDSLSTPDGVLAGGAYAAGEGGFRIDWTVSQNMDGTWHYRYDFTTGAQLPLTPGVSHIILELSDNISSSDLFNFGNVDPDDPEAVEFGTFGEAPGNPGFPSSESIFGVKIDLFDSDLNTVEFDSTRQPHWADFYVKGSDDFAYNTDIGVGVSNPSDFLSPSALDESGNAIYKILAPNAIPAPGALGLLVVTGLLGGRRRRS